jgi:hypothetical protein
MELFQKALRKREWREAVCISKEIHPVKVFERLLIMTVEDVGPANITLLDTAIEYFDDWKKNKKPNTILECVKLIGSSPKSRCLGTVIEGIHVTVNYSKKNSKELKSELINAIKQKTFKRAIACVEMLHIRGVELWDIIQDGKCVASEKGYRHFKGKSVSRLFIAHAIAKQTLICSSYPTIYNDKLFNSYIFPEILKNECIKLYLTLKPLNLARMNHISKLIHSGDIYRILNVNTDILFDSFNNPDWYEEIKNAPKLSLTQEVSECECIRSTFRDIPVVIKGPYKSNILDQLIIDKYKNYFGLLTAGYLATTKDNTYLFSYDHTPDVKINKGIAIPETTNQILYEDFNFENSSSLLNVLLYRWIWGVSDTNPRNLIVVDNQILSLDEMDMYTRKGVLNKLEDLFSTPVSSRIINALNMAKHDPRLLNTKIWSWVDGDQHYFLKQINKINKMFKLIKPL